MSQYLSVIALSLFCDPALVKVIWMCLYTIKLYQLST